MTRPGELTEALGAMLEGLVAVFPIILMPALAIFGFTFLWKSFKAIAGHTPSVAPSRSMADRERERGVSEKYRRQQLEQKRPDPLRTVAEAIVVKNPDAGPPRRACDCPVCRGDAKTTYTPPSLDEWEDWKYYGLVPKKEQDR